MSDILSVRSAVQKFKYIEALEQLQEIDCTRLSSREAEEYWKIFSWALNKIEDLKLRWSWFQRFVKQCPVKERYKILKEFSQREEFWSYPFFLLQWWEALIAVGNLQESKSIALKYINYLLQRKNFHRGLDFIERFKQHYKGSVEIDLAQIRFLLMQENYIELDKVLKNKREKLSAEVFEYFYLSHLHEAEEQGSSFEGWKKSQYIFEIILEEFYQSLEVRGFPIRELRGFVNLLYEYLVFFPNESFGVLYLLKYALISKKKSYVYKIKEVALSQKERFCTNFDYEKDIMAIIKALDSMRLIDTKDETIIAKDFDFATDLIHGKQIRENMIKKLERDIAFLKKAGKLDQVEKLKAQLRVLDKGNTIFFDETSIFKNQSDTTLVVNRSGVNNWEKYVIAVEDEIADALLFSVKEVFQEENSLECKHDLFVMFYMLGDPELIKRYLDLLSLYLKEPDADLIYYKILYFKMINDVERVISFSKLLIDKYDINYELELELWYQMGELLFKNGDWERAQEAFKKVITVDGNYRMVKQRLWMMNEK